MICLKLHLKAKNTSGGSPELPEVSGGAPCRTDMDCIEGVNLNATFICITYKEIKMFSRNKGTSNRGHSVWYRFCKQTFHNDSSGTNPNQHR